MNITNKEKAQRLYNEFVQEFGNPLLPDFDIDYFIQKIKNELTHNNGLLVHLMGGNGISSFSKLSIRVTINSHCISLNNETNNQKLTITKDVIDTWININPELRSFFDSVEMEVSSFIREKRKELMKFKLNYFEGKPNKTAIKKPNQIKKKSDSKFNIGHLETEQAKRLSSAFVKQFGNPFSSNFDMSYFLSKAEKEMLSNIRLFTSLTNFCAIPSLSRAIIISTLNTYCIYYNDEINRIDNTKWKVNKQIMEAWYQIEPEMENIFDRINNILSERITEKRKEYKLDIQDHLYKNIIKNT